MTLRGNHLKVLPQLVGLPVRSCRLDAYGDNPEWIRIVMADGIGLGIMFLPEATEEDRNKVIDILRTSTIKTKKPKTRIDLTFQQQRDLDEAIRAKFLFDNPDIAVSLGIDIE